MRFLKKALPLFLTLALCIAGCKRDDKDPATASRDNFIGTWQCDEYGANQQLLATFQVEIIANPNDAAKVLISNFNLRGQGNQATGIIENTSITIQQQLVSSTTVSGSGFITNNYTTIELQYIVDDGSGPENITATYTKL